MPHARPCFLFAFSLSLFSSLAGDSDDGVAVAPAFVPPAGEWYSLVWGSRERVVPAWLEADIKLIHLGIVQNKNGPCGVLTAINAVLLANALEREGELDKKKVFSAEEFVDALASIVEQCTEPAAETVQVAVWQDEIGGDVHVSEQPKGEGGDLLLLLVVCL